MKPKIVIVLNTAWNLINFRSGLIRSLVSSGYEVVAVAPSDHYATRLPALGARFVPLPMDNKGTNPVHDLLLLWRFYRLLKSERPDVLLAYTIKPNIYGSIAAQALGIPVINNIAGLGSVFARDAWLTKLVRKLYRLALSRSFKVFFQNDDDRRMFVEQALVRTEISDRLPGSGVDLAKFTQTPVTTRRNGEGLHFLLLSRLLWDKGIGEYVEAARDVKHHHPNTVFCLLGFVDVQNPAAITRAQVDEWVSEGVIQYLGVSDNVAREIGDADCIVLPSFYREGVPKALLEAAAIGRPIITTNAIGCRDVVDDNVNGYLCRPRDAADLAEKMKQMIALSTETRAEMGKKGRDKVEREFDEEIVIGKYMDAIRTVTGNKP